MIDEIKSTWNDHRGVSPVIGVILMVAITVILAAVIGTFVLGLGDSLEQAPQSQLSADSNADNSISINHNGGDPLPQSDITINVNGEDYTSEFYSDTDEFSVGGVLSNADSEYPATATVTVIHDPSESILLETDVNVQGSTSTATATSTPTTTPTSTPTTTPTSTPTPTPASTPTPTPTPE